MAQYNLTFNDTGLKEKTIIRGTSGTHGVLQFVIKDEGGNAVNFTGMTTVEKIYIGVEGTLKVNGVALTSTTAATGLATFELPWGTFSADSDAGTYYIQLYLADNASATKSITTSKAVLKVLPSLVD